jgi:hypothetical protein
MQARRARGLSVLDADAHLAALVRDQGRVYLLNLGLGYLISVKALKSLARRARSGRLNPTITGEMAACVRA